MLGGRERHHGRLRAEQRPRRPLRLRGVVLPAGRHEAAGGARHGRHAPHAEAPRQPRHGRVAVPRHTAGDARFHRHIRARGRGAGARGEDQHVRRHGRQADQEYTDRQVREVVIFCSNRIGYSADFVVRGFVAGIYR